ncbi:EmrB/QacA subfamily drug resistance transporter [Thermocatellispora tengchongensis]|uniref:EmrB/QacA subfamily drug resistance transporter n=1 Tax=Thermocatellispora tengchongensis TaxID=1073253 RepID=A0A840NZN8_9ACTN|nr:MFS transporter [Thermocatellispora tengchongensis]MBB5131163.1 EmrB/QacA subfamily drug resistance transporter [Thermocatellispora tengchongensis]
MTPTPGLEAPPYRWRWIALAVILAAEVMDLLDALVTNVAGPTIQKELGGSASLVQWLGAGYTTAMAVGLITGGRLGDLYGRKRMFLIGAAGFTASSLLCGVAGSPEMLIGARVLQGLFGAVMLPQGLGLIKEMFPPKEMAAAFGAFGPIMGLSSVGGPVLAGWLVEADFFGTGWRMIFLINLPVGLLALAGAIRFLPESRSSHAARLDLPGVGLVSLGAFLLIFPLVQGHELDWPAWTFVSIAASPVVFACFAWFEARKQRRGGDPLVVPSLFRKRAFTGGLLAGLVFFSALIGFSLVFTLYAQLGLGYDPLHAGLASLPHAIGGVIGFVAAGAGLAQRLGRVLIHIGALVMAAGVAGLALTLTLTGPAVTIWQLAPALGVAGLGMGLSMAPFFDIVLAGVEPHESGSASGTLTAIQQLGGALGIAVLGTVFFNLLDSGWSFEDAARLTIAIVSGMLVLTFALAFLLPLKARPEQTPVADKEPVRV